MAKNEFADAVEKAQTVPDAPEIPGMESPDLLSASMGKLGKVITDEDKEGIPGVIKYDIEYYSARLTIGQRMLGFVDGHAEFEELDESAELKKIMDKNLSGQAILLKKDHSFLKDGTVIVWIEWGEYVTPPPQENRNYLTEEELTSPDLEDQET